MGTRVKERGHVECFASGYTACCCLAEDGKCVVQFATDNILGAEAKVHLEVHDGWPSKNGVDGNVFAQGNGEDHGVVATVSVWCVVSDDGG